jgi:Spy/CpxP family protein refolding chaperone
MRTGPVIILTLSILLLHASGVWAQKPRHGQKTEGNPPCWLPEDLHLTPKQINQIESIQQRYVADIGLLRNEIRHREYELRILLSDPTSDAAEIRLKQRGISELENQIEETMLEYQLEMRDVLTPEQFGLWISKQRKPFGRKGIQGHRKGMMPQ